MSFSKIEYKAQQRRISDSNRRINLKARFQKEKDRLRAEQRQEIDSDSDTDCYTQEAGKRYYCCILSLLLVFIIVYTLLVWQFFVYRRV